MTRPRVVVAGTGFGRVYLAALAGPDSPFQFAGVLARGSGRSTACAHRYGVPLWTAVEQLPADVNIACVVVPNGVGGGRGAELAREIMARGVAVLHEHPIHPAELAGCLRAAAQYGVAYRLTTFYPHLPPVRRFVAAARYLLDRQRIVEIEAACAVHVSYGMIDILGRILGGLRPWSLEPAAPLVGSASTGVPAARAVHGTLAGVPVVLRVANHLDPHDPDNATHILHRITLVTEGGTLALASTHGPVLWSPCLPAPRGDDGELRFDADAGESVDGAGVVPIGPPAAPGHREVYAEIWPAGVRTAVAELAGEARDRTDPMRAGQVQLTVGQIWQHLTSALGYPDLIHRTPVSPVTAAQLTAAADGAQAAEPVGSPG